MSPDDLNAQGNTADSAPSETEQLREEIEETREELGETVEALAQKADVKAQASQKVAEKKEQAGEKVAEIQAKVTEAPQVQQATQQAKEKPWIPIAAAAVVGLLVLRLLRRRGS